MTHAHEQCSSCLQIYAYELEVRCMHCDGAACQFCAVRIASQWICLGCKEESDGGSRDVES
jgi:hypothetical protein